jgi:hypothetical protein
MTIKITDSEISKDSLIKISDFNESTKKNITDSDILILPNLGFRDENARCFPAGTSDFLKLAKQELKDYCINLCENEGNEKSLTLHSGEIWIPILMISIDPLKDVVLPTLINFVSSYIFYKFSKDAKEDKVDVHLKIIVEDKNSKTTKQLSYEGNVSGLKAINVDAKSLFEEK